MGRTSKKVGGTIHFDPQKDHKDLYDKNEFYTCVFSDLDGHKFNVFLRKGCNSYIQCLFKVFLISLEIKKRK